MDRLTVQKKLLTIKKLPIRPQIIQELIQLSQNSKVSMSEYVTVISKDPGLAGEILKVVNSSYYGLKNHISDLKMALSMLGLREIYRIAANSIFYKVFRTIFDKISYDLNLFWT
ncbi:MAG: HDOD domain-containing protein, partial [Calditrichae bacterium]|nr:HDOD domain-containing protein [Calditrichia bacterium]